MGKPKQFRLKSSLGFFDDVEIVENQPTITEVEVLRVGTLYDRGMKITQEMLQDMADNFVANVVGSELMVNKDHKGGEACGWVKNLRVVGDKLMATIEWTNLGVNLVKDKLYKYVSAEFYDKYPRSSDGKTVKNVFTGLALTNEPALKNQKALELSENFNNLTNTIMLKSLLADLLARETITKADVSFVKNIFEELSEEEKGEVAADVEAVETKVEEAEAAAAEEAEKAEESAEEAEEAEKEELAEKIVLANVVAENNKLSEQVNLLMAEKRRNELSAQADKVLVSATGAGLPTGMKEEALSFMLSLDDQSKVDTFVKLMSSVVSYTPGSAGYTAAPTDKEGTKASLSTSEVEAQIKQLKAEATKLSEDTGRSYEDCLSELTAAVYSKKTV